MLTLYLEPVFEFGEAPNYRAGNIPEGVEYYPPAGSLIDPARLINMITEAELRKLEAWAQTWKVIPPGTHTDPNKLRTHLSKLRGFTVYPLAGEQIGLLEALLDYPENMTELEFKFWSKVHIVDDDDSDWLFGGNELDAALLKDYGTFGIGGPSRGGKGKTLPAHRMAFALSNEGELPPCVRHTCDIPPCVRPSHLVRGTQADNMRDKFERGRGRGKHDQYGERNDSAVLTSEVVVEMRRRYKKGESAGDLSRTLGVSLGTIQGALTGVTWGHLNHIEPPTAGRRCGSFLSESDVRQIRREYTLVAEDRALRNQVVEKLAERYVVTTSNIKAIVTRKSWKHVTDDEAPPTVFTPNATLTDEDVIQIRRQVKQGADCAALVPVYRVTVETVRRAAYGRNWEHLNDVETPADSTERKRTNVAFTEEDVRNIRSRHAAGESVPKIHLDYPERGLQTLYAIVQGRTWKHVD